MQAPPFLLRHNLVASIAPHLFSSLFSGIPSMSVDSVKNEAKNKVISNVKTWLNQVVIGLGLCPFAKQAVDQEGVLYHICEETGSQDVLDDVKAQLEYLENNSDTETTLIILTACLQNFDDYNNFLDWVDLLILKGGWEGQFQIASFHPDYCFADVQPDSAENLTNRSPYPLLHILREQSLEKALESYPDADNIPMRNIAKVNELSDEEKLNLFPYLFKS